MLDEQRDEVAKLRKLGVGFVVGGLLFGALSFVGTVYAVGGTLIGLGLVVWYEAYRDDVTVGTGPGIALVGVVGILEAARTASVGPLEFAAFAVGAGVVDYLLAPAYGKVRDAGEQTRERDSD